MSDNETRLKFIQGDRLYLRSLVEKDADGPYLGWLNDEVVCRGNSHHVYPYTRAQAIDYIQHAANVDSDLVLAIVLKEKDRHIGNIALARINRIYRSAQFAILLGDKDQWSKGYGLEAGRLIVHHGFFALNLRRIECATFETNQAMKKLALALGMREEGTRRQAAFKDGKYLDVVEYGVLRGEFEQGRNA